VTLRILSAPAAVDTPVLASSADPLVADMIPTAFVVPAGQQDAVVTVSTGVIDAETVITLDIGTEVRTLAVVVGLPNADRVPLTLAPSVGVEVQQP